MVNPGMTEIEGNGIDDDCNASTPDGNGVGPDSHFWGLDRAIERLTYHLSLGKSSKAQRGLRHALERLHEVRAMILAKRLDKAQEAADAFDETMADVEDDVEDINGDEENELEEEKEAREQIRNQHRIINSLKLKTKGMDESEQEEVEGILEQLENVSGKVEVKLNEKSHKTKIKIKAKEGLNSTEVAELEGELADALDGQAQGLHKPLPPPGQVTGAATPPEDGASPGKESGTVPPGQSRNGPGRVSPGQAKKSGTTGNAVLDDESDDDEPKKGKGSSPGQQKKGSTGSASSGGSGSGSSGSAGEGSSGNSGSSGGPKSSGKSGSKGGQSSSSHGGAKGNSGSKGNSGDSKGKE
jgi:hypothetical protein